VGKQHKSAASPSLVITPGGAVDDREITSVCLPSRRRGPRESRVRGGVEVNRTALVTALHDLAGANLFVQRQNRVH